jgi:hypothetical protein
MSSSSWNGRALECTGSKVGECSSELEVTDILVHQKKCGISEIWLTLRIENGGKGNWWERCRSLLYQKEKD